MNTELMRNYARLIAVSGVNVKKGQECILTAGPEQFDFLEMLIEELYKAGAGKVTLEWSWQSELKLHVQYQDEATLGAVPDYTELKLKRRSETLPCYIYLHSEDPDGLNGMDQEKWARARQARNKITKPYDDASENKYQWCVAAVPGRAWAKKVFPALSEEEAVEKLWEAVLRCSRALNDDPMEAWRIHDDNLRRRCEKLNSLHIRRLLYRSESTGTDFSVGLLPESRFMGGADKLPGEDVWYNANIPSEEVFTTPKAGDAEGLLVSTMPLSYRGVLIEDFSIRFENGRVSEVHAKRNEEALRLMVSMDEGAAMLGECALVPYESPIRQSGILFYNTLFDENASCHLALGAGYSMCLDGFEDRTQEEAYKLGVNDSMIHEDFMIGAPDLSITGITEDGSEVAIFRNGTWAE